MMRWPWMTKAEHERQVAELRDLYQGFVDREYTRATKDGMAKVRAFMVEANANVFRHPRPELAIRAVFQQAHQQFSPEPLTVKEVVVDKVPTTIEEAIASA